MKSWVILLNTEKTKASIRWDAFSTESNFPALQSKALRLMAHVSPFFKPFLNAPMIDLGIFLILSRSISPLSSPFQHQMYPHTHLSLQLALDRQTRLSHMTHMCVRPPAPQSIGTPRLGKERSEDTMRKRWARSPGHAIGFEQLKGVRLHASSWAHNSAWDTLTK